MFTAPKPLPFPVQHSILAAVHLAELLGMQYGFSVRNCRLLKSVLAETYMVDSDQGARILRVYPANDRSRPVVNGELAYLDHLWQAGLSVAVPIARQDGALVTALNAPEGERLAVLFSYATGISLRQQFTPVNVRALGQLTAAIHRHAEAMAVPPDRPPLDWQALIALPLGHLKPVLAHRPGDWQKLRNLADWMQPHLAAIPLNPPFYGFIHGDLSAGNAHVDDHGRVTLFDFDFCGPGWRIYDVATFLINTPPAPAAAFLEGYESLRALSPTEHAALPAAQIARQIWMLGSRGRYLNQIGLAHFQDSFLDRVLASIDRAAAQLD